MEEIFELIKAFNRLKEKIIELIGKIDLVLKTPPVYQQISEEYIEEEAACKILHVSSRTLARMRMKGSFPYIKERKRIL